MIDAREEFYAFKKFIKDRTVLAILKSYVSEDNLHNMGVSVKQFNPKRQSTVNGLLFHLDIVFEAIKPQIDSLKENAAVISEIFAVMRRKGAAVIPIYEDFVRSLDNLASKAAIEESLKLFSTLKEKWDENVKARVTVPQSILDARNALENGLQEVFAINDIRERIFRVIENIKQSKPDNESATAIFHKRRRSERSSEYRAIPRMISVELASPEEQKMMDERKTAIDKVWKMVSEYPRPYETMKRLEKENDKLKEDVEFSKLQAQEIKALETENENLTAVIAKLRSLTEKVRT